MPKALYPNSELFEIFETKDGSNSVINTRSGDTYHSIHGALQESTHIFIKNGLHYAFNLNVKEIFILELGFGTGLNTLLSVKEGFENDRKIFYQTLEKYPLSEDIIENLHYMTLDDLAKYQNQFKKLHNSTWEVDILINPNFTFSKKLIDFSNFETNIRFDLIYHDAFSPQTHPEAWSEEFLKKCYNWLKPGGFIITYCAKGSFKRALKQAGFIVENLIGPIGKREITRAFR